MGTLRMASSRSAALGELIWDGSHAPKATHSRTLQLNRSSAHQLARWRVQQRPKGQLNSGQRW